jgi:hypothetical protein
MEVTKSGRDKDETCFIFVVSLPEFASQHARICYAKDIFTFEMDAFVSFTINIMM